MLSSSWPREENCSATSEPILAEYEEVMRRPRLGINPEKVTVALGRIRGAALLVHPVARVTVALDPDDNIFLECAEASAVHLLVTGNTRHFPPRWAVTHIVTPRQFMDARSLVSAEPAYDNHNAIAGLVFSRHFVGVIDHEDVHRNILRLDEPEAELILKRTNSEGPTSPGSVAV